MPSALRLRKNPERPTRTASLYDALPNPRERRVDLERAERLRTARRTAGYARAVDAINAFGWNRATYFGHENGRRGLTRDMLLTYANAFHVEHLWLAFGQGPMRGRGPRQIRIEGLVGDLATIESLDEEIEPVEMPEGFNPEAYIAMRVKNNNNRPAFWQGWTLLFLRNHGGPENYFDQLCLVTLADGRRLIRTLLPGTQAGRYTLTSPVAPSERDVKISSAAPLEHIKIR